MRVTLPLAVLAAALPAQNQGIQLTNGIDGSVDVPFHRVLAPPTGFTFEAWITYNDATIPTGTYRWPTIARMNPAAQQEMWFLRVSASNVNARSLQFSVRDSRNGPTNRLFYNFAPGEFAQWTHLAATYDGLSMRMFKNGQQIAQLALPVAYELGGTPGPLRIGNGDPVVPGNETWNGMIDEVRIWPFARDAAEIRATMNQSLYAMPGKVVTFNLDGFLFDTSRGLIGSSTGTVNFVPGAPGLQALAPSTVELGQSTSNCPRTLDAQIGSVPLVGNGALVVWCTQGPPQAASPLGIVVAASSPAPPGQPPLLGLQLAFDLTSVIASIARIPPTDALGNARFPLPIPPAPGLAGNSIVLQFGFVDLLCGPQDLTASNGIQVVVQ